MNSLTILNSREVKKIQEILHQQFSFSLQTNYAYLRNENDRIFVVNRDITKLNLRNLKIDKTGLYLGELKKNYFRLSKEGAQLFVLEGKKYGKKITNIVDLGKGEVTEYFQGNDLVKDLGKERKLILLQYQDNIIGCANYKEGTISNFLPKTHRGEVIL